MSSQDGSGRSHSPGTGSSWFWSIGGGSGGGSGIGGSSGCGRFVGGVGGGSGGGRFGGGSGGGRLLLLEFVLVVFVLAMTWDGVRHLGGPLLGEGDTVEIEGFSFLFLIFLLFLGVVLWLVLLFPLLLLLLLVLVLLVLLFPPVGGFPTFPQCLFSSWWGWEGALFCGDIRIRRRLPQCCCYGWDHRAWNYHLSPPEVPVVAMVWVATGSGCTP